MTDQSIGFLLELEKIIQARISQGSDASYTSRLADSGLKRVAQKVGEEAVELVLAAAAGDRDEQIDESADLLYHLLVLLSIKGIDLADVVNALRKRHRSC
jgi:phosphoribosyl-ATP pyrophosphohydrolase/phosphoribosyl-AMP cyclohydrolase